MTNSKFAELFKKYRLKAEFDTLSSFGAALAEKGLIYEDSILSHWQNGSRIPKNRRLLLAIGKIFIERKAINSIKEANILLESAGQGHLTEPEIQILTHSSNLSPSQLKSTKKMVKFMHMIGKSKQILRSGWVREKIKDPESVAEHSFRLSVLAMTVADYLGVDKETLIHMAIIHDLGEVITGDIVWNRGAVFDMKLKAEKDELERKGIEEIFQLIEKSDGYTKLFEEMLENKTEEAKVFWQLDKLEMAIQALEYEKSNNKKLDEFFINADLCIQTPFLKEILKEIIISRN